MSTYLVSVTIKKRYETSWSRIVNRLLRYRVIVKQGTPPRRVIGVSDTDRSSAPGLLRPDKILEVFVERLSAAEISRITHLHPSALKRYLSVSANRVLLGVADDPPTYPAENLPLFRRLTDLHESGTISPRTLENLWPILFSPAALGSGSESGHGIGPQTDLRTLVPSTQVPPTQFTRADLQSLITIAVVDALQQTAAAHPSPLPPDAPLTRQQAAAVLGCHPNNVSRHVTPVMRGVYSSLMVQAVFARWRSAAEEKQREKVSHNERRAEM